MAAKPPRLDPQADAPEGPVVQPIGEPHEIEYASCCWLPANTWTELPLCGRFECTHDSTVYEFELPRCTSLNLPACSCLLLQAPGVGPDGTDAVRPYTPISENCMLGKFQLLIKRYEGAAVSQYMYRLKLGDKVRFKHIKFNVKKQYPFPGVRTISLVCAGSGITPVYQALLKLMNTPGDTRQVVLLNGNRAKEDMLLFEELREFARLNPNRLTVVHCFSQEPLSNGFCSTDEYIVEHGRIDEDKMRRYLFPPADDTCVMVCGLPIMYDLWCGPRAEPELKEGTVLHRLGYTSKMIAKL